MSSCVCKISFKSYRFAVAVAKCLGDSLFGGHSVDVDADYKAKIKRESNLFLWKVHR